MKVLAYGLAMATASVGLCVSAAHAEDVIKIGVDAAESGAFVSAGNTIPAAVKLAVKEINDAGGIKVGGKTYKFEVYLPGRPHRHQHGHRQRPRARERHRRARRSGAPSCTTSRWR